MSILEVIMFTNYLKTALRNIQRHKVYSLINIFGLSLGLASCLLIYLWIHDEKQYDQFHENRERIYQVYSEGPGGIFTGSFYPLAKAIKEEVPGIEEALRVHTRPNGLLKYQEKTIPNNQIGYADPPFFKVFSFPLLSGSEQAFDEDKYSILLAEETSRKLFGGENPIGQVVTLNNQLDLTVRGVIQNVPKHSSLRFDCIVPFSLMFPPRYEDPTGWGGNPLTTFVLLNSAVDPRSVEQGITATFQKSSGPTPARYRFHLHPLAEMHMAPAGDIGLTFVITLFSIIAAFVSIVACINYMNLSTARASERAKEVGLRKVIGASRALLMGQFIGEALVVTIIASFIAMLFVALFIPIFNTIAGKQLVLQSILQGDILLGFALMIILTGLLAGSYPALYLSSSSPFSLLRQDSSSGKGGKVFRNILVTVQFTLTTFLLIGLLTVNRQMQYIQQKDYGFDREHLAVVRMTPQLRQHAETIRNELLKHSQILNVAGSFQNIMSIGSSVSAVDWDGKDPGMTANFHWDMISYDYIETMNMKVVEGRAFSREFPSDTVSGYMINEEAATIMNIGNPVGKRLSVFRNEGRVIGVVKNFHFQPFYSEIRPFVFWCNPARASLLFIKVRPGELDRTITTIRSVCGNFEKESPVEVLFFNDALMRYIYTTEDQVSRITAIFTILIIVVASLGLLGLTVFVCEQRRKEFAIRKVLGSSTGRILGLLSGDFLKWIVLANGLAWPLAYFAMEKLLGMYAYRAGTDVRLYLFSGLGTLLLALMIISYQTIKTATANPVDALKHE